MTVHDIGISLLLLTSVHMGSFKSMVKEGHPKFSTQPGWGFNPGPSGWQSEILPTVSTSHAQFNSCKELCSAAGALRLGSAVHTCIKLYCK